MRKPPLLIVKTIKFLQNLFDIIRREIAPPFIHVTEMAAGGMKSQLIYLAAKLEIADRLKDRAKNIEELAQELSCNIDALYRFLRALAPFKIITEISPGVFKTTKYGRTLQKDNPKSLHSLALLTGEEFWRAPLSNLIHSINTGEASFDNVYGMGYFEYLKNNPEKFDLFSKWMENSSNINCPVIAVSYPFYKYESIVDVGGGYGALLAHILALYPNLKGTLFDLPETVHNAKAIDDSIKDRCTIIAGNFMKEVPSGSDLYIMQQIMHDWSDDICIKILQNIKNAMNPNGRILIVDAIIKPGNSFNMSKLVDLQIMATCHGGLERTKDQFLELFRSCNLKLVNIYETASPFSILEVKKI